jgi:DNA-binding transcriptional LysR family regulator
MENKLEVMLFERTTRRVLLTEAGEFMRLHSRRVLGDVDAVMQRLRMEFAGARKEVKVGVSRSITLAHLPGLFAANQRLHPEVLTRVYHRTAGRCWRRWTNANWIWACSVPRPVSWRVWR